MSHFYSSVESKGTTHSKCGDKDGMEAHLRGWNTGVRIILNYDEELQQDMIYVYRTGGSNNPYGDLIATIRENE